MVAGWMAVCTSTSYQAIDQWEGGVEGDLKVQEEDLTSAENGKARVIAVPNNLKLIYAHKSASKVSI